MICPQATRARGPGLGFRGIAFGAALRIRFKIPLISRWAGESRDGWPGPDDFCRNSRPENQRGFIVTERYFL